MHREVRPHYMFSKLRTYRNIVKGRFNITDIIRIERKNDEDTISNKTYDLSSKTINTLVNKVILIRLNMGRNTTRTRIKTK
ncbi:MAG: hypothetical protein L0H53_16415 [Candidatus Nitrosocosmicus sp.]|nr:hypothetical protein [Candidatus Nitrosocosmicus sp.]